MQHNQHFVESLIALRDHYQALLEEYDRQAVNVREQLTHVNALLVDQLVLSHNQHPVSIHASINQLQTPAIAGAVDIASDESFNEPKAKPDQPTSSEQSAMVQSEPAQSTSASLKEESPGRRSQLGGKTPMLPQFQQLTKLQAVENLLRENSGTLLHIDYIIRTLYGELKQDVFKGERQRMYQTLSEGTKKHLWEKVPEQVGCYTIDLKLVAPELVSKQSSTPHQVGTQEPQSTGKSPSRMLPPYQHLTLIDAVEAIVRENPGEILTIDFVTGALYGELSGKALTEAKDRIGGALWSGAQQKRWQRVPNQMGRYTLDLKLKSKLA